MLISITLVIFLLIVFILLNKNSLLEITNSVLSRLNPNVITTVRLILTPFALISLLLATKTSLFICLFLMIVIELTNYFDGYIARKYRKISSLGKIYDPMCDVVYHLIMYLGLTIFFSSKIFIIVIAIILFREICVAYLRVYCAINGLVLAAMKLGKIKAVTQMISIFSCVIWLLSLQLYGEGIISNFWYWSSVMMLALALIMTLVSLEYYWSFVKRYFIY